MTGNLEAWPLLLGWPAVVLSVLLASLGIFRRSVPLLVTAVVLVGPMSLYVAGSPRLGLVGLTPVAGYLFASGAIRRGDVKVGATMVALTAVYFGWLAWYLFA